MKNTFAKTQRILGIEFFQGTAAQAVAQAAMGGLVVCPAAPALKDIVVDAEYREALLLAGVVLTDSAYMVLCWRWLTHQRLRRLSGLAYLREILLLPELRSRNETFWVMPSQQDANRNCEWLVQQGVAVASEQVYIAPLYRDLVEDAALLAQLERLRPRYVFLAVGGGTQEKLGSYLVRSLSYQPSVHCIGAAIAFLTGSQVHIPVWADRLYLGWLFRSAADPKRFVRRYWEARSLFGLLRTYGEQLPPLRDGGTAETFSPPSGSAGV